MLKLNYTDVGLYMERVITSPEKLIAQRLVLAMRLGQCLHLEPGRASFLLPAGIPELIHLERAVQQGCGGSIVITPVDEEFVEVGLKGIWVAETTEAHEGMLLTVMDDAVSETVRERVEFLIYKLWQMSETYISSLA